MSFDSNSIMNRVYQNISEKINAIAEQLKSNLVYDAQVEGIDLSDVGVSIEKTSDTEYDININLNELSDYHKQLVRDIYYNNALKRRKW